MPAPPSAALTHQTHSIPVRQVLPSGNRRAEPASSNGANGIYRENCNTALKWLLVVVILMLLATVAMVIGLVTGLVPIPSIGMVNQNG